MEKFIIDTQLPPALARFLSQRGFDAIHTTYFPNGHLLADTEIVKIAIRENRIIVSKDSDFFDNFLLRGAPPQVLLLQFGNIKNRELLRYFDLDLQRIIEFFDADFDLVIFDQSKVVGY